MLKSQKFQSNSQGSVAIILALALVPMTAFTGAAIDYSRAAMEQVVLQNDLDAAVIAGARAGSASVSREMFTKAHPTGVLSSGFTLNDNKLEGHADSEVETSLLHVIGISSIQVKATSAAEIMPGEGSAVCILVKNASASEALKANSNVKLNAPNCEIHVRAGTYMNDAGAIKPKRLCTQRYGGNNARPAGLETGCTAISDPFAGKLPTVALPTNDCKAGQNINPSGNPKTRTFPGGGHCNYNFNGSHDTVTFTGPVNLRDMRFGNITTLNLQPGLYENITFNSGIKTINLAPGLYIWRGITNLDTARLVGDGVTIYYPEANSLLRSNSGGSFDLKAPASGPYAGILIYEREGLGSSGYTMDGSAVNNYEGLIYLPSRHVHFNASSRINASKITMVTDRLSWDGGMVWNLEPGPRSMTAGGGSGGGANVVRLIE